MTAQEYHLKKQQIARLKNILKGRFMTLQALECMRAIIECEKYDDEKRNLNYEKFKSNNE